MMSYTNEPPLVVLYYFTRDLISLRGVILEFIRGRVKKGTEFIKLETLQING